MEVCVAQGGGTWEALLDSDERSFGVINDTLAGDMEEVSMDNQGDGNANEEIEVGSNERIHNVGR